MMGLIPKITPTAQGVDYVRKNFVSNPYYLIMHIWLYAGFVAVGTKFVAIENFFIVKFDWKEKGNVASDSKDNPQHHKVSTILGAVIFDSGYVYIQ